jgi:hypothetical protein
MYIQNHHIQNVLNEYRKRLSQPISANTKKASIKATIKDTVQLSEAGQRQTIMNQVSADIIERISRTEVRNGDMATFSNPSENTKETTKNQQEMDFIYTTIDENNQKSTQIIPITHLRSSMASMTTNVETRIAQRNQPAIKGETA